MDQGKYDYKTLQKKYDNFSAPGFEITLAGKKLTGNIAYIPELEVELSADGTAGGCSFRAEGQYDFEKQQWVNDVAKEIKPGAKLVVKGGYGSTSTQKELFYGYVDDYSFDFSDEGVPRISISGLDGLGYLMNMREPYYGGKKKAKQIVQTLLNKSVSAGFAKSVKVGMLEDFEAPILKEQIDDWKFLRLMAQRCGASLFVVDGEMIFDSVTSGTTPILTLTIGKSVRHFQKRVSLAHQVGKVEVWGRDENQKAIKGTASSVNAGGSGKSAAELVPGLKDAVLREYNEFVRTQKECENLAQHRLDTIAMGLVSGSGECVGIPELIPGRYIKIDGGDKNTNGTYFLSRVSHRFRPDGYTTAFEIKGAKV